MLCKKLGVQFKVVSYDRNLWSQTRVCVLFLFERMYNRRLQFFGQAGKFFPFQRNKGPWIWHMLFKIFIFPICDPTLHLTVSTTTQFLPSILTSLLQLCLAAMLGQTANNRGVLHSLQNPAGWPAKPHSLLSLTSWPPPTPQLRLPLWAVCWLWEEPSLFILCMKHCRTLLCSFYWNNKSGAVQYRFYNPWFTRREQKKVTGRAKQIHLFLSSSAFHGSSSRQRSVSFFLNQH